MGLLKPVINPRAIPMRPVLSGGVGQSVRRKEDNRFLRGQGEFVADIKRFGLREVAFLRSPIAHGRIKSVTKPHGRESDVYIASDLDGISPIRADSALPGFKSSVQPVLASGKVRYVGEIIAACVAGTRADAEDLVEAVEIEFDELPVVSDMLQARAADAALLHDHWGDNVFLETFVEGDEDIEALKAGAAASALSEIGRAHV